MKRSVKCIKFNENVNRIIEQQERDEWKLLVGHSNAEAKSQNPKCWSALLTCNRFIIAYLSRLHRMDLTDLPRVHETKERRRTFREKMRRNVIEFFRWRNNRGQLVLFGWPNLVLLFYLFSVVSLCVRLPYEWSYDVHKIKLRHLKQRLNNSIWRQELMNTGKTLDVKIYEDCLTNKTEQIRDALKWFGPIYLEWSIVNECVHAVLIVSTFAGFVLAPIVWYNCCEIKYFPTALFILDPTRAIKLRAETVRLELNVFIDSSRYFTRSALYPSKYFGSSQIESRLTEMPSFPEHRRFQTSHLSLFGRANMSVVDRKNSFHKHLLTIEQLKVIVLQGRLRSLARDPIWFNLSALLIVLFFSFILASGLIGAATLCWLLYEFFAASSSSHQLVYSYGDLMNFCATALLIITALHTTAFFQIINSLNVIDLFEAAHGLKTLIYTSIKQNAMYSTQLLAELDRQRATEMRTNGPADVACLVQVIDLNLLTVIVRYKLFYRRFMQIKRALTVFVTLYCAAALALPISIRLLAAYLDPRLRLFAFSLCFTSLLPAVLGVAPLCQLHSSCLATYKALSSLLAQLVEFETQPQLANCLNFDHIESSLRKELAFSQDFRDKFAVRALGTSMTYNRVIGIIFWLSLILLSLLEHDDNVEQKVGLFSSFLKDPLGLANFQTDGCLSW